VKIGVIFCAFQAEDLLARSLGPWIETRRQHLGGHEFIICAVSVPFEGFDTSGEPEDRTRAILGGHAQAGEIDHAIVRDKPMKETEARGAALRWLVAQGVDTLIQWDSDEFPTTEQIERILAFVAARPHIAWFRLSYKNRVFTPDQYLVQPFTPPRIHRVQPPGTMSIRADIFYEDNGIVYGRTDNPHVDRIPDHYFPSLTIPKSVAWIDHWTWLSDLRSKRKQAYQWARWQRCDFAWDDSRGGLIWRDGQPVPETARD
jgi:hypothetical protein